MKNILFMTHENIEKTAVAKAMFYDIAVALKNDFNCRFISGGESVSSFEDQNGLKRYQFKRTTQGKIAGKDIILLLQSSIAIFRFIMKADIIYIRSYPMMILFSIPSFFVRKKIIFDTRGLFFEELFDSGKLKSNIIRRVFSFFEKLLILISSKVICVSKAQKEYYLSMVDEDERYKIIFNGTNPSDSVLDERKDKVYTIGYVGSLIRWHCPNLMGEVLNEMQSYAAIEFHCITRDIETAESVFSEVRNKRIYSHNYRELPVRFDLGICFISDSLSKSVCFPVKFAEYLVSGTPVAFSNNVSVCKEIHDCYNVGLSLDINSKPEMLAKEILDFMDCLSDKDDIAFPSILSMDTMIVEVKSLIESLA